MQWVYFRILFTLYHEFLNNAWRKKYMMLSASHFLDTLQVMECCALSCKKWVLSGNQLNPGDRAYAIYVQVRLESTFDYLSYYM